MSRIAELVAEFVPLNRRRLSKDPPLVPIELQRWVELRDLLAWEFGSRPPIYADRDRALRIPSHLKVRYGDRGESAAALQNLSEGGLFIQAEDTPVPGTPLYLQLEPGDGAPPLDLEAVVIWRREMSNRDGPAGFGIEFRNLDIDVLPGLLRLIERELREIAASSPS